MTFKEEYLNSLLSKKELTSTINIEKYIPKHSIDTKHHLHHLMYFQAFDKTNVQYPYHCEMKGLNSYLILYTHSGSGTLYYHDMEYSLDAGSICFIDCHEYYKLKINHSVSWAFSQLYLNGSPVKHYYDEFMKYNQNVYMLEKHSPLITMISSLHEYKTENNSLSDFHNAKRITDLLSELLLETAKKNHAAEFAPKYIAEIKELFDNNYDDEFSLDSLAQTFNHNKYKIVKDFKHYIHQSPIDYLIERRIDAAKTLLYDTEMPVNEIGTAVGIENTTHFINMFKKQTGVTPLKYRNQRPLLY